MTSLIFTRRYHHFEILEQKQIMTNVTAIVDSHMHLWDPNHIKPKWLDSTPSISKAHLPTTVDLEAKITSKISLLFVPPAIEAIVYVETDVPPAYALLEAEWVVSELAAKDPRIQGIVANAPLEDGEHVRPFLEALVRIGRGGALGKAIDHGDTRKQLVKGVRRILQSQSPEFCLQPSFVNAVQLLAEYNFSYDICCRPPHLESVIKLVAQCPSTQFVLDHLGKPTISSTDSNFEKWKTDISNLANFPNVYCKLSGMVTEALPNNPDWKSADLQRYAAHILSAFGPSRVMFGSDWPVVKLAEIGYNDWLDIASSLVASLSDAGKQAVWNGNARKFYKL